MSAEPLAADGLGEADWDLNAYVSGAALKSVEPVGLDENALTRAMILRRAERFGLTWNRRVGAQGEAGELLFRAAYQNQPNFSSAQSGSGSAGYRLASLAQSEHSLK